MQFDMQDKLYIITGASSGLGRCAAKMLDSLGARVIAIARNKNALENLKNECKNLEYKIFDFSSQKEINILIDSIIKEYGKISGIAYFAGIERIESLQMESINEIKHLFDIHLFSFYEIVRILCDKRKSQDLSIVAISSISSLLSFKGLSSYSIAKGAINTFVKTSVLELAKYNARINAILPGDIQTNMTKKIRAKQSNAFSVGSRNYPLGLGKESDVANLTCFLLSPLSAYISGQCICVDGGYSSTKE